VRQRLGNAGGLIDFGVNLVHLPPGNWSSQRHWHSAEDEFVYLLEGEPTLIEDGGDTVLRAGDCAAFPKGSGNGHHLINKAGAMAVYLEIGARSPADVTIQCRTSTSSEHTGQRPPCRRSAVAISRQASGRVAPKSRSAPCKDSHQGTGLQHLPSIELERSIALEALTRRTAPTRRSGVNRVLAACLVSSGVSRTRLNLSQSDVVKAAPRACSYSRMKAATSPIAGVSGTSNSQVTGKCVAADPKMNASWSRNTASQS
jgi:uncharacterized cupin superfamily protein